MRLSRRDALVALAGGAATSGVSLAVSRAAHETDPAESSLSSEELATVVAVATVVYPSAVEGIERFVETYVSGLDDARAGAMGEAAAGVDRQAREAFGTGFAALSADARETVLRDMGVDRVASNAEGTLPERARYHLVNTLLYALFTSPTGSGLVGIDDPVGCGSGFATYRTDR